MKRSAVVLILAIVWFIGGCAASSSIKSRSDNSPQAAPPVVAAVETETAAEPAATQSEDSQPAATEAGRGTVKPVLLRKVNPALTIYFKRNSNELGSHETAKLDKVAETLHRSPDARATLSGYTDSAGSKEYNLMVAEGRASSVKFYLVAKGIDPGRLAVVAKGAANFAADNDTDEGRNLNRRVEIKFQIKN